MYHLLTNGKLKCHCDTKNIRERIKNRNTYKEVVLHSPSAAVSCLHVLCTFPTPRLGFAGRIYSTSHVSLSHRIREQPNKIKEERQKRGGWRDGFSGRMGPEVRYCTGTEQGKNNWNLIGARLQFTVLETFKPRLSFQ